MDFSATILAATGSTPPEGRTLDGIDIVPILSGEKPPQERIFYWRVPFLGDCKPQLPYWQCSIQKAVRKGDWKYVRDGVEQVDMLFDLRTDPSERKTLTYEKPELVEEMKRLVASWEQDVDQ